jgi:hypothetical protein
MATMTPKKFWETAAQWGSYVTGGDPGACMYGFDEKGLVQSEEHRAACIAYIEGDCRKAAIANGKAGENLAEQNLELDTLIEYLKTAPVAGAMPELDAFTTAYIVAALWSTNDYADDQGGDPLDANYGPEHIAPAALERMIADCARFQELYGALLVDEERVRGLDHAAEDIAGHDFWLTRAGHGAGFWDGDWREETGEILTRASKSFGEVDLYVGDDGLIYSAGGNLNPALVEGAPEPQMGPRP